MSLFQKLVSGHSHDPSWPGGDWPVNGEFTPREFEIIVGAVLTQNTRWENVEIALGSLNEAALLSPQEIIEVPEERLQSIIRPAGFYRQKARTLKGISSLSHQHFLSKTIPTRRELLSVKGIGPETADSILLYAFRETEFVIDSYTKRLLARLGFVDDDIAYSSLKALFEDNLPKDIHLFKEFHALIVQHGKKSCRKKPLCSSCCLRTVCPLPRGSKTLKDPPELTDR